MTASAAAPAEASLPKNRIPVFLPEGVHSSALEIFREDDWQWIFPFER